MFGFVSYTPVSMNDLNFAPLMNLICSSMKSMFGFVSYTPVSMNDLNFAPLMNLIMSINACVNNCIVQRKSSIFDLYEKSIANTTRSQPLYI